MSKKSSKAEPDESSRMWASASFVGVLIVIGLPLWWKTTEVYRVSLPYDKIAAFDALSHVVTTELKILANDEPTVSELAGLVEKAFEHDDVIKLKITKSILPDALHQALDSVADEIDALDEVASHYDLEKHNSFYLVQRRPLFQDTWVGSERVMFFRDAKASQTAVQALREWVYQTHTLSGARAESADAARRLRFPHSSSYRILMHMPYQYNLEQEADDYIGSFVDELSDLHNFTLKTQSLYMLNFDFQAKEVKDTSDRGRHFAVRQDRLHLLLTRLEERAAARDPARPDVNLALYAVPCEIAPLLIHDHNGLPNHSPVQAFISPKWGGVVLSNPTASECADGVWRPQTRVIMGTFVAQLRKLLGITGTERIQNAHLEPLRSVVPRKWEVDNLLRIRTLEQLTSAERTLQSLAQLLGEISNIVINDEVGASINSAVESTQIAAFLIRRGELLAAYQESQQGSQAAETAFMEPSLLALLYFPDDQKYAIYIPLFLPIMFPVVLSLKNLFLWFRGKPVHKEKTD